MSGMNPGLAAYLAGKKATKSPQPMFKSPVKSAPRGKRHSKIMKGSTCPN